MLKRLRLITLAFLLLRSRETYFLRLDECGRSLYISTRHVMTCKKIILSEEITFYKTIIMESIIGDELLRFFPRVHRLFYFQLYFHDIIDRFFNTRFSFSAGINIKGFILHLKIGVPYSVISFP
jgi:hypothetical protein